MRGLTILKKGEVSKSRGMEGWSKVAREAAEQTQKRTAIPELMRTPGYEGLQHYWMTPWFDHVRFGRWNEIAGKPNPAPDLIYVTAIWHYAQGMAATRTFSFICSSPKVGKSDRSSRPAPKQTRRPGASGQSPPGTAMLRRSRKSCDSARKNARKSLTQVVFPVTTSC